MCDNFPRQEKTDWPLARWIKLPTRRQRRWGPKDKDKDAAMDQPTPPPALIAAIEKVLTPLVRLLVQHGITYPALTARLKPIFVVAAEADLRAGGGEATDSRISVMTGVHRKDVKRLRGGDRAPDAAVPAKAGIGTQAIGLWCGDPRYLDGDGQPLPLPRRAASGPSFDGLVESVSTDVRPRTLLDDWLRLGLVRVDDDDRVHLDTAAFVPREGFDELAYFFGRNLHDHIASAASNLSGARAPYLERAVFYDGLTAESVAAIEKLARDAGSDALVAVNRETRARLARDKGRPDATRRMSFGVYFFDADDDE
jgi:hypothetical protein